MRLTFPANESFDRFSSKSLRLKKDPSARIVGQRLDPAGRRNGMLGRLPVRERFQFDDSHFGKPIRGGIRPAAIKAAGQSLSARSAAESA